MNIDMKDRIRETVCMAVRAWRNTEWDASNRELIRSAFMFIRKRLNRGHEFYSALGQLESDAYRHFNA